MANEMLKSMSLVKAADARPLSDAINPIWRTREIAIWWPADNLVLAEDAAEYLEKYTSTINGQEERLWVDDPYYGTEKIIGRFRNVSVKLTKHEQKPAIVQVLRKDWITALPSKEADDDEVRMMNEGTGADPFTGDTTLARVWRNIDPDYAEDILTARKATQTVTNPQVDIWDKEEARRSKKVYEGKFAVTRLALMDQDDGAKQLVEGLVQVHIVDELADLLSLNPRLTQENEIFDLFAPFPAPGEGDTLAFTFYNVDPDSRPFLMDASTDANLVTYIAQKGGTAWATATAYVECDVRTSGGSFYICVDAHTSGVFADDLAAGKWTAWHDWVYASKKFVEQEDNTGRFYILFREVSWQSWGHDAYAFDSISYDNAGDDNLSEARTKRYVGITTDDIEAAVKSLRSYSNWQVWATSTAYILNAQVTNSGIKYICHEAHTSGVFATDLAAGKWVAETGFIQIGVRVDFNPQNGSCSLSQTVIEQINDEDQDGDIVLNPHSLHPGKADIQTTLFTNFTKTTLPVGDTVTATGNVLSNIASIQGNGLWQREVKTKIPTWTNDWTGAILMSESNISGHELSEVRQATGVPETSRAEAYSDAKTASDTDRLVVRAAQAEGSDGERIISSVEKKLEADGTRDPDKVLEVQNAPGNYKRMVVRTWYNNSSDAVTALTTPTDPGPPEVAGGKAAINFSYTTEAGPLTFTHLKWNEYPNGDGSSTVTQVGVILGNRIWVSKFDTEDEILEEAYEMPVRISGSSTWATLLRCQFRQIFDTAQAAANYATGSDSQGGATQIFDSEHGTVTYRRGSVKYLGNDKWAGRLVTFRAIGTDPIWNATLP